MSKVIIEIRNNVTGVYYRVPVTPESIAYQDGDAMVNTVKILGLGNVDFPDGIDLDTFGWSSFFPGKYDQAYCTTKDLKKPIEYRNIFSGWKDASTSLQLICAAAGINKNMKLVSFTWELRGFEGDIYYQATFREVKTIKPKQIDISVAKDGTIVVNKPKPSAADRPAAATAGKPATHTVKSGDTLTGIAKRYSITPWTKLYDKNKAIIGPNPGLIKPGQVLKL